MAGRKPGWTKLPRSDRYCGEVLLFRTRVRALHTKVAYANNVDGALNFGL